MLKTHDDVPDSFRDRLYAAEKQKSSRKRAVPGNPREASLPSPPTASGTVAQALTTGAASPLDIPGYRDDAVKDYVQYLQGQWRSEKHKDQFEKAGNVVLDGYLDLDQVYKEQQPDFFTDHDVERGIATLFIKYIPVFAKRRKLNSSISIGQQDANASI